MKKLIEVINKVLKINLENINILKVEMDSRKIKKDYLFFAINNGKNYIKDVLEKGASLVICDDLKWQGQERVIVVKNSVETMQNLAREYRKVLSTKIIGIVGSNGKTTTKDIVYSILSTKYKTQKTLGNYNNHIGVPYTILNLNEKDEFLSLEMGMSSSGEIKILCDIALPDYAIITNIGDSHLEFLKNRKNVFLEKSEIKNYVDIKNLVLFGDDEFLKNLFGIKIGFDKNNDYIIKNYTEFFNGVKFEIKNESYEFSLNGKHNAINASMGVVIGQLLGLSKEDIQCGLDKCKVTSMRFEKIVKKGIFYINDAYNASPISMKYSLETFSNMYIDKNKVVILGDMSELGENEIEFHKEVLELALSLNIEKIILFGKRMKIAAEEFKTQKNKIIIKETKDEIKELINKKFSDKIILLKGSNSNHLWEIMD